MIVAITAEPRQCIQALAEQLATQNQLKIVSDPSVSLCQSMGYQTLYDIPVTDQMVIREQMMRDHLELLKKSDNTVFQYSIIEQVADWCRWLWSYTSSAHWNELVHLATDVAACYDVIYRQSNGVQRVYDGYHWLDQDNANQIDSLIPYVSQLIGCHNKIKEVND